MTVFAYTVSMIFLESFVFVSQITILCFVAVIVFPTSSFGYIFFLVAILYYLFRLTGGFGNVYLDLLSIAVDKSSQLDEQVNSVQVHDGTLEVSNVLTMFRNIRINDIAIDVPRNTFDRMLETHKAGKVRTRGNMTGIPRTLFNYLIQKHRPVYIQVLKLSLQFSLIITLAAVTLYIIGQFDAVSESERSDVMHVVFVLTIGALPRILEVMFIDGSEVIQRQIEEAKIEQSIVRYWRSQSRLELHVLS